MRICIAALAIAVVVVPSAHAGDKELLDKFKRQNEQGREKLVAEIKLAVEKADALEKKQPVQAMLLLQETRDRMLQKGHLTAKEDRDLAEPLWDRIKALRIVVRARQSDEMRAAVADFKSYQGEMKTEFAAVREAFDRPGKEALAGEPAFLALANGTQVVGWLHEPPVYVVNATIDDQPRVFAPGTVGGLQTPRGFYLYDRAARRFTFLPGPEFFLTAITAYQPARNVGFWVPSRLAEPPPGYSRRAMAARGALLFGRSAGILLATWGGVGGLALEDSATKDPTTARLYRDALLDLMVQEVFTTRKKNDQSRFREVIVNYLDRRPGEDPLNAEEIVKFAEAITAVFPELRSDALTFVHLLNRLREQTQKLRKK